MGKWRNWWNSAVKWIRRYVSFLPVDLLAEMWPTRTGSNVVASRRCRCHRRTRPDCLWWTETVACYLRWLCKWIEQQQNKMATELIDSVMIGILISVCPLLINILFIQQIWKILDYSKWAHNWLETDPDSLQNGHNWSVKPGRILKNPEEFPRNVNFTVNSQEFHSFKTNQQWIRSSLDFLNLNEMN